MRISENPGASSLSRWAPRRQCLIPEHLSADGEHRLREAAEVVHRLGTNRQTARNGRKIGGERKHRGPRLGLVRQQLLDPKVPIVRVGALMEQQRRLPVEWPLQMELVQPPVRPLKQRRVTRQL